MSDQEKVADLLEAAADALDEEGWIQHQGGNSRIGWCAVGAMVRAMGASSWDDVLGESSPNRSLYALSVRTLAAQVRETVPLPGFLNAMCEPQPQKVVEWWNDSPGRTVADVTMTLRKTALTVRERVHP